jgi:hypothetical protein
LILLVQGHRLGRAMHKLYATIAVTLTLFAAGRAVLPAGVRSVGRIEGRNAHL